jgi:hypothetical protein
MAASGVAAMIVHGTADATVRTGMYSRDYWLAANGCSGAATVPTDPAPCVACTDAPSRCSGASTAARIRFRALPARPCVDSS